MYTNRLGAAYYYAYEVWSVTKPVGLHLQPVAARCPVPVDNTVVVTTVAYKLCSISWGSKNKKKQTGQIR